MSYKPLRQTVTLAESGLKITLRPLSAYDRILILNQMPDPTAYKAADAAEERSADAEPAAPLVAPKFTSDDFMNTIKLAVGAIVVHPLGQRIVAKKPEDLTDGSEISFFELPENDQGELVRAYSAIRAKARGPQEVAGTAPAAFSGQQAGPEAAAGAASDGGGLRPEAEQAAS